MQQEAASSSRWLTVLRAALLPSTSPRAAEQFRRLQGPLNQQRQKEERNRSDVLPVVRRGAGGVGDGEVLEAAARIDGNAFRVGGRERAVYPLASMLNHDCASNARVRIAPDRGLALVAKRAVAAGEALTVSYCSPLLSTRERRDRLERSKCFHCRCRRCLDPTESGTYLGALLCPRCEGGRVLDHGDGGYRCDGCAFATTAEKAATLLAAAGSAKAKACQGGEPERMERALSSLSVRLPPTNSLMLDLKNELASVLAADRSPRSVDRRIEIVSERMAVLKAVDEGASRLLGFLAFRLHCLQVEKVAVSRRGGKGDDGRPVSDALARSIVENLRLAAGLLAGDMSCPPELTELTAKVDF